jgi:hypothetical protein
MPGAAVPCFDTQEKLRVGADPVGHPICPCRW